MIRPGTEVKIKGNGALDGVKATVLRTNAQGQLVLALLEDAGAWSRGEYAMVAPSDVEAVFADCGHPVVGGRPACAPKGGHHA